MNTKVWTYAIGRTLSESELSQLLADGRAFVKGWTAHEQQLEAGFEVFKNRIVVVTVNEDVHNASGCSIDKLSRFMKELGAKYQFDSMNRLLVALKKEESIDIVHASGIKELLAQGKISENTVVYNTAVSNHNEFLDWEQPLKHTWLNKYLVK
ncbi:MAG: hypothetical protein IT236_13285 [Bacteroidia bacterium]|nr:hypothetical protein [Bacteroidia bacterium]